MNFNKIYEAAMLFEGFLKKIPEISTMEVGKVYQFMDENNRLVIAVESAEEASYATESITEDGTVFRFTVHRASRRNPTTGYNVLSDYCRQFDWIEKESLIDREFDFSDYSINWDLLDVVPDMYVTC